MLISDYLRGAAPTKPTGTLKPKPNTKSWEPPSKTTRDQLYDLQSPVPSRPAQPPGLSRKLRTLGPAASKLPPAPPATTKLANRALARLRAHADAYGRMLDRARALARASTDKTTATDVLAAALETSLSNVQAVLVQTRRTIEGKL